MCVREKQYSRKDVKVKCSEFKKQFQPHRNEMGVRELFMKS